jgi:hypothetical protein
MIIVVCFLDAIGDPLQRQYHGPFKVRKGKGSNYAIKINNYNVTVSIARLKPAFVVPDDLEENTAETRNVLIPVGQTNATIVANLHIRLTSTYTSIPTQ